MKNLLLLILMIALFSVSSLCQERQDIIYMTNGNILKGIIVENVPNDYVKIELEGGSLFTVKYEEIEKFGKGEAQVSTSDETTMNAQKMMMYENAKKSRTTAMILSWQMIGAEDFFLQEEGLLLLR